MPYAVPSNHIVEDSVGDERQENAANLELTLKAQEIMKMESEARESLFKFPDH